MGRTGSVFEMRHATFTVIENSSNHTHHRIHTQALLQHPTSNYRRAWRPSIDGTSLRGDVCLVCTMVQLRPTWPSHQVDEVRSGYQATAIKVFS